MIPLAPPDTPREPVAKILDELGVGLRGEAAALAHKWGAAAVRV